MLLLDSPKCEEKKKNSEVFYQVDKSVFTDVYKGLIPKQENFLSFPIRILLYIFHYDKNLEFFISFPPH